MKGDELFNAIADRDVHAVTSKGKTWSAVFKSDGTVTYDRGGTGTWRIDDDKFCDFPMGDKEYCGTVFRLDDNKYQMFRLDGTKGSVLTVK